MGRRQRSQYYLYYYTAEIFALELTLLLCMYSQKGRRKFLQLLEDTNDQSLETHNLALA